VHEQPAAKDAHAIIGKILRHLAEGMIDGERRSRSFAANWAKQAHF
jgi:hypothetical protein